MKKFSTNSNIVPEVEMNQILLRPVEYSRTSFVLNYDLYDIDSVNTREAMILASPAEATERQDATNVFYVQKISDDAILQTAVPGGSIKLTKTDETNNLTEPVAIFTVSMKYAEEMNE